MTNKFDFFVDLNDNNQESLTMNVLMTPEGSGHSRVGGDAGKGRIRGAINRSSSCTILLLQDTAQILWSEVIALTNQSIARGSKYSAGSLKVACLKFSDRRPFKMTHFRR